MKGQSLHIKCTMEGLSLHLSLHLTSSLLIKIHEMKLCDGSTVAFKPMKTLMVLILILCEGPCVQGMYIGGGLIRAGATAIWREKEVF